MMFKIMKIVLVFVLPVITVIKCAPTEMKVIPKVPTVASLEFMKKYGYLENLGSDVSALYTDEGISDALKKVQLYGSIPQTGIFDEATLKLMSSKRCGVPDIVREETRFRRFVLAPGWNKRTITYSVANWSPNLGETTVVRNIQKALDIWGQYGHLKFIRTSSPDADIIVAFGRGHHGDSFPFDGKSGVLAHAFFPNSGLGGDIHFDDDENWSDAKNGVGSAEDGTDFFTVALHELGHSLGLQHSPVRSSIMFPYYKNEQTVLDYDDILGMYELYIKRPINDTDPYAAPSDRDRNRDRNRDHETTTRRYVTTPSPRTRPTLRTTTERRTTPTRRFPPHTRPTWRTTPRTTRYYPEYTTRAPYHPRPTSRRVKNGTTIYEGDFEEVDDHLKHDPHPVFPESPSSLPKICDGYFDAVTSLGNEVFIFKNKYAWRLKRMGVVEPGYPVTIQRMFAGLPTYIEKIDAAYQRPDGHIILFTDNMYWRHDGSRLIEAAPRPISDYGLPHSVDKIDAAMNWIRNGKTYFFKDDMFWRYNEETKTMDPGYPMKMDRWRGVPTHLDAATSWNRKTYFFKDQLYWKFDDEHIEVAENSPLPSGELWLGCPENIIKMEKLFGHD